MYSRHALKSGFRGQLFESKLISLLYFRAIHNDTIEEFQLASNFDNIGAFDDICFKAKIKKRDKPLVVFLQAKYRVNKIPLKIDLAPYFMSYLKIKQRFYDPSSKDLLINGAFHESECLFVIYTNARDDYCDESVGCGVSTELNDLIDTGGTVKQPNRWDKNVEFLAKIALKAEITSLAQRMLNFMILGNSPLLLTDNLVRRYHVVLAQKVFNVTELQPNGHRIAFFRHDFFDTYDEYLTIFKDTVYKGILEKREVLRTDIKHLLSEILTDPTDASKLSKLIGTVMTYNNGLLEMRKKYTEYFTPELKQVYISQATVNQAVEQAAKAILLSPEFTLRVPAAFGNKDITLSGNDKKKKKRITYLTSKITHLLDKCGSSKTVTIDESVEAGLLQLNGGIAGAIGNIFVLDDDTKLMKITNDAKSLGPLATTFYEKLTGEIHNLHEYKFCFQVNDFPKLSFGLSEYDVNVARDFLNKLLFYSNQADDQGMEEIIKMEIDDYQSDQPNYFQAKTDAILLKFYDEIQNWWKQPQGLYLTKTNDIFKKAVSNIIGKSVMDSINDTYMSKIKQYHYTFTEDAVSSLNLQEQHSTTVVITENSVLTVVKVMQCLKYKGYAVLDLEYIVKLPKNDRNVLRIELMMTKVKVLIFICDEIHSRYDTKALADIAKAVTNKRTIIISNETLRQKIQEYFPKADHSFDDKKLCLSDMSEESRENIFGTATAIFPGGEIELKHLIKGWPSTGQSS